MEAVLRSMGAAVLVLDGVASAGGRIADFTGRIANYACLSMLGVTDVYLIWRTAFETLPELSRGTGRLAWVAKMGDDTEFDLAFQRGAETAWLHLTAVTLEHVVAVTMVKVIVNMAMNLDIVPKGVKR